MKKITHVVGLAVNPEFAFTYDKNDGQSKHPLTDFSVSLSGTSGDVAIGLHQLGERPLLIGAVGNNGSIEDRLIPHLVQEFPFVQIPVLEHSSIAVFPNDGTGNPEIAGRRGMIIPKLIGKAKNLIKNQLNGLDAETWRIATGLLPREVELGIELLGNSIGYRSLNPNRYLCQSDLIKTVMEHTDLFIVNWSEYIDTMRTLEIEEISKMHNFGPSLIVVTDEMRGGIYSFKGETGSFDAKVFPGPVFPPGSGDWFHVGLIKKVTELVKPIQELVVKEVEEALDFAALVAGKKVHIAGASKGPWLKDLV